MSGEEEVEKNGLPTQYIPSNGLQCTNLPDLHAYVLVFCLLDRPEVIHDLTFFLNFCLEVSVCHDQLLVLVL